MNDPNFAPLVLGVLSVLVSIAAFVLGDSEKNKSWRIALGISFLFLAIMLGTYGVVVLMLPGDQGQFVEPRASENPPAAANASAIPYTSTPESVRDQANAPAGIQPTPISATPTSTLIDQTPMTQEPTATPTPAPTATDLPPPTPTHTEPPPTQTSEVSQLTVDGNACDGAAFIAPSDGTLQVSYAGGSYSPWANDQVRQGQWRTVLYVYADSLSRATTPYGTNTPTETNRVAVVGCDTDLDEQWRAEACASAGPLTTIAVRQGETLIFAPIDDALACLDNRGSVSLTLEFTAQK